MIEFPVSGVETYWWLPVVVSAAISCLTSPAGLSGAFLLLPFQVSVLGYTSPGVTPTNLIFNIVAIPGGVYRYAREKRMVWPLVWTIAIGTIPGLVLGVVARVKLFPDPDLFKLFVGLVLLYIAGRLILDIWKPTPSHGNAIEVNKGFEVTLRMFNARRMIYDFNGERFRVSTPAVFILSLVVGMIGGIYGIGGGAIIAPFLVTIFGLPVHSVAGAALCGTFISSVAGVLIYLFLAPAVFATGHEARPDLLLGLMLGVGGMIGVYTGSRLQRYLPARVIKTILAALMLFVSLKYVIGYFQSP